MFVPRIAPPVRKLRALKTWLISFTAHALLLILILYVNLNRHPRREEVVEVGVYSPETKRDAMKEAFTANIPKPAPVEQSVRDQKKDSKNSPSNGNNNGKPGAPGGSTAAIGSGNSDTQIKTGGTGEGYGIGSGGQAGKPEDNVYHVGVEIMPEPYGGISGISAKIKLPDNRQISGNVYILGFIDESGVVRKAQVTKGIAPDVDAAVQLAVRRTRFKPGKDKGELKKVQMVLNIPVGG